MLEAVLGAQGHNPSAKREIEGCGSFSDHYARIKDPSNDGNPWVPVGCEDAKRNADWVLFRDPGARLTYNRLRRLENKTPYEALFGAQAHNRTAQGHLEVCRAWADAYAMANE